MPTVLFESHQLRMEREFVVDLGVYEVWVECREVAKIHSLPKKRIVKDYFLYFFGSWVVLSDSYWKLIKIHTRQFTSPKYLVYFIFPFVLCYSFNDLRLDICAPDIKIEHVIIRQHKHINFSLIPAIRPSNSAVKHHGGLPYNFEILIG